MINLQRQELDCLAGKLRLADFKEFVKRGIHGKKILTTKNPKDHKGIYEARLSLCALYGLVFC